MVTVQIESHLDKYKGPGQFHYIYSMTILLALFGFHFKQGHFKSQEFQNLKVQFIILTMI